MIEGGIGSDKFGHQDASLLLEGAPPRDAPWILRCPLHPAYYPEIRAQVEVGRRKEYPVLAESLVFFAGRNNGLFPLPSHHNLSTIFHPINPLFAKSPSRTDSPDNRIVEELGIARARGAFGFIMAEKRAHSEEAADSGSKRQRITRSSKAACDPTALLQTCLSSTEPPIVRQSAPTKRSSLVASIQSPSDASPGDASNASRTAYVSLALFQNALPPSATTFEILESLPNTQPQADTLTSIPTTLREYHVMLHKDAFRQLLVINGRLPGMVPQMLQTYLALLVPLRLKSIAEDAEDEAPKLPPEFEKLFMHMVTGFNPGEKALAFTYLAILARKLALEDLQDLAEKHVLEVLDEAARRIQGWAWFNSLLDECWIGAVRWDKQHDIDVDGIISLVKAIFANPAEEDVEFEKPAPFDYKRLCEGGVGTRQDHLPQGEAELWLEQQFKKDDLTEAIYNFVNYKFIHLRFHPEMQKLLRDFPQLAFETLMRYRPYQGIEPQTGRSFEFTDWEDETTAPTFDQLAKVVCEGCAEKADRLRREGEMKEMCICGLKSPPSDACYFCSRYDPDLDDEASDGDESEDEKDDDEVIHQELQVELEELLAEIGEAAGDIPSIGQ
ncbi:hypothetical protein BJ508DRAFT_375737 [Ascobolus immersus RN42]|uniref:Uncharacterized protein n=1 Tax=Ascobolus immersus RN42 TaxID=1160509 RepID=A0A3N4I8U0_ASCIM|nr:hypothetical protein BJ508DRAFT_375737 [Ascobolus immersus RN42]